MWKHYFRKKKPQKTCLYAWKIFIENAINMVSIIPSNRASEAQTFRNHHHLASSHRTQWKHLVFIGERVSCIHVWRTPFSVVPIHRTVHHKNESWTDGNSLSRKIQMYSCVKCTRVSGNFSLLLSILTTVCFEPWQKLRARLGSRKTGLRPPVFLYWPFQGGTSVVVPYCYLFLLSVFILWFSYYVSDIFVNFR